MASCCACPSSNCITITQEAPTEGQDNRAACAATEIKRRQFGCEHCTSQARRLRIIFHQQLCWARLQLTVEECRPGDCTAGKANCRTRENGRRRAGQPAKECGPPQFEFERGEWQWWREWQAWSKQAVILALAAQLVWFFSNYIFLLFGHLYDPDPR